MTQTTTLQANIATITRLEDEAETDRSISEHASERIGRFAGTIYFVIVQVCFVGVWIGINLGSSGFDPFPFPFLAAVLSFEAVLLTAFILMRQNRMSARADRRNRLALQINLLSEQEATKIIQMLERLSRQMGIEAAVTDSETRALGASTSIDGIVAGLRESLNQEPKPQG